MIFSICFLILALTTLCFELLLPGIVFGLISLVSAAISLILGFKFHLVWGIFLTQLAIFFGYVVFRTTLDFLKNKSLKKEFAGSDFKSATFDEALIGREGVVIKDLKPSGVIEIDGKHFQAQSFNSYIKCGEKVKVIGGEGFNLNVRI